MKKKLFAAIDVGSFELAMKIFEISSQSGLKEIDHIRHRLDLGTESYKTGKLSYDRMEELCRVLKEYAGIMEAYKVTEYRTFGTSAIRELENTMIVLDRIKSRTGLDMSVLSNSEQRFLDYKSIAAKGEAFETIIQEKTAILDMGGGSIQVSLFDNGSLFATQNMNLGILRLHEQIKRISPRSGQIRGILDEVIHTRLNEFKKLYLKEKEYKNLIVVDDYISNIINRYQKGNEKKGFMSANAFMKKMENWENAGLKTMAKELDVPEENVLLYVIAGLLLKGILEITGAVQIWAPGVTLCDGIAYDYAEQNKLLKQSHDFEQDILSCARSTNRRYQGSRQRSEALESIALTIFDSTRKIHGMGARERLLLRIAALLYDCGKYISLSAVSECSYHIIMRTEIIGLSHLEREIVANVVKYNQTDFAYYEEIAKVGGIDREDYLKIAKLTAILRLACGLDRSHKKKFTSVKASLHENELWVQVEALESIEMEKGLFQENGMFFEEVYSIRPILKQKKTF
ncbi:MAG: exopolyphosphatase [Lachnospiraceae bacterium]|nr:exopolyphosphatase [Lachnospiraceae bacterium]